MNQMIRMGLGIAALALMSCGDVEQDGLSGQLVGLVTSRVGGETAAPQQMAVTQEQILASRGQFLRVNIRELERWDTMVQAGANNGRTTWIDSGRISLTLDEGIVVATRGLQRDLMGADTQAIAQAVRAGGGTAERRHDFLNDQDQITTRVLQCGIESKGSDAFTRLGRAISADKVEERCTSDDLSFTNIYWLDRNRTIIRSLQAVSPDAGYVQVDVF